MSDVLKGISTRRTPQTEPARADQVRNSAGGFVFSITPAERLRRFLLLGTDGPTFYASAPELTKDNAAFLIDLARTDPMLVVDTVLELDRTNRAPKHNTLLFALAVVAGVNEVHQHRAYALRAMLVVARTGTHILTFVGYVEQFRGWGRGLRKAVAAWYTERPVDDVAFQAVKYRNREGWTHRDVLRVAHPDSLEPDRRALFGWIAHPERVHQGESSIFDGLPDIVRLWVRGQEATKGDVQTIRGLVDGGLTWEMLPNWALGHREVWTALVVKGMPLRALVRQLPRLTRLGVLDDRVMLHRVIDQLNDAETIRKSRMHPINFLVAQRTYANGASARGDSTWSPDRRIVDALDAAFYYSFGNVTPTGKRTMLALDVSGSMTAAISNLPLSAREASAALALVTMAVEQDVVVTGFTEGRMAWLGGGTAGLTELTLSPRQRLDDALRYIASLPFGGTDCSLPMLHALEKGLEIDTFVVYTDSETYAGRMHPHEALRLYRERTGIDAKLVVVGMTATGFSIADPQDAGMLDVVGFDAAAPELISTFARGQA